MARVFKIILPAAIIFTVSAILAGCGNELAELRISGDTYLYIPSVDVGFEAETTMAPDITEVTETTNAPEPTASTVYWVASGKVWHTTENCKSLSRSKNIESGTADDALLAGKERVCSVCGG